MGPEGRESQQLRKLLSQDMGAGTLERLDDFMHRGLRIGGHEDVDMVGHNLQGDYPDPYLFALLAHYLMESGLDLSGEDGSSPFRAL